MFLVRLHCGPVVDFTNLHPFDFDRNLFIFLCIKGCMNIEHIIGYLDQIHQQAVMEHKMVYLVILCCALIHMSLVGADISLFHTLGRNGTITL